MLHFCETTIHIRKQKTYSCTRDFQRSLANHFGGWVALLSMRTRASVDRCRANVEHMTQPRPGSGLGFQVQVLATF